MSGTVSWTTRRSVWLMTNGSWQLRFQAHGTRGDGVLAVPVPATSMQLKRMNKTLGAIEVGQAVNIEIDVVARYLARMVRPELTRAT